MAIDFLYFGKDRALKGEVGAVLEKEIYGLLNQGEKLLNKGSKCALELFDKADKLYLLHGYDFDIESRINDLFFECIDRGLIEGD